MTVSLIQKHVEVVENAAAEILSLCEGLTLDNLAASDIKTIEITAEIAGSVVFLRNVIDDKEVARNAYEIFATMTALDNLTLNSIEYGNKKKQLTSAN